jgi:hypothetical protein
MLDKMISEKMKKSKIRPQKKGDFWAFQEGRPAVSGHDDGGRNGSCGSSIPHHKKGIREQVGTVCRTSGHGYTSALPRSSSYRLMLSPMSRKP